MGTEADILRCARDLYLREGFAGLSMRAVADCAGVSAPAIYRHFENKEALVTAVCIEGFRIFGAYLARGLRGADARERLDLTGKAYCDFGLEQRGYYVIMFMTPREQLGYEAMSAKARDEAAPTFQFLVDRVRECMDERVLAKGDPRATAFRIWAYVHGLVSLWITGADREFADAAAFRAFFTESTRHLVGSLAPHPSGE